ncbi:Rho GTPase-activating protein 39 [Holothuria leucospilota]|uniref:Rho GTPase-activating protein 39 n=1 Tax=Holothuria leucospilota TaxID=206669 RepID=A0A9Q1CSY3_HOLLE|nr:Rho GTPase-activating protein 39 [Holothuria leucospilota]
MMTEGQVEWVEIIEPKSQRPMYGNLRTGELAWHPPLNASVKKRDNNQWWELFDPNTSRFYYYNEMLQQTVWHRPQNCDIIPLAKLQTLKLNTEARSDDSEASKLRQNQGQHRHRHHHKHHHHRHHHNHPSSDDLSSPNRGGDTRQHRRRSSEQLDRQQLHETAPSIQHGRSIHQIPAARSTAAFNSPRVQRAPLQPIDTSQRSYPHNQSFHGRSRSESAPMEYLGGAVPDPKVRKLNENNPIQQQVMVQRESALTRRDMSQETYVESTASNVSQSSDHSQDFLTAERSESRSSQSSHHSREGYGTHPRAPPSDSSSVSHGKPNQKTRDSNEKSPSRTHTGGGRQVTSPKVQKRMPKMGVRAAIRQHQTQQAPPTGQGMPQGQGMPPGYPAVSSSASGIVHSHSGEHFNQFYPGGHHPSHVMVQPGDQNHHLRVRQGEHPPLVQSMSYHGRPSQRTTTPDSLSSQESYPAQPMLVPYAVTTIATPPDIRSSRHAAHKHSDSQLSQSSQVSYNSQQSLSSQHSDSSARPVTSDSHSHVSQSSDDVSFNSDMRNASIDSTGGMGYVAANVHAIANANLSPEHHPQGSGDVRSTIYMNTEFIHQKEKEKEQLEKLREMDKRDAERAGSPTLPLNIHRPQRPGSGQNAISNGSQDENTVEELSDKEPVSEIEALLNHSFDTEGTEESSRETSTNVDTSSPLHTPGSPLSPGSNQGSNPANFFHASLQRGQKLDSDVPSSGGPTGAPPMERSISVQEQRPSSAKHGTIPASMKTSPSLTVMGQPKKPSSSESDLENYAAENLNRHKKGLLRKKVSLSNMLSWTKEPIKKPMLITGDKAVKKEAVETFKLIQSYMGDRPFKGTTKENLCLELISKGWSLVPLRDEIYMQLCRQTTDNYFEESLRAGWELLSIALNFFPPTQTFFTYLDNYIRKHTDGEYDLRKVPVKDYSEYCLKRLERCFKLGARKGTKSISQEEIHLAKESIFNPSMFGELLEDVMALQKTRFPDRKLPWIVVALTEEVHRLGAPKTEGIFRVPGDIDEVNSLKLRCDQWLPLECVDPHVPASLLKFWYRELYEPLIPMEFYDRCIEHCEDITQAQKIIDELPEINRLTLCHFIRFLQGFVKEDIIASTKMDINNLAMVMAPDILRCDSENPHIIFENTRKEMSFLRTLICHQDTSFMEGII